MANEKRLIDANAFRNLLQLVVYDVFTVHEQDGELTGTASVGYYTETIEEVLKRVPTVDAVEVVHGRWVATCDPDIYQCGHCKKATKMDELCDSEILRAYCPNCGAKMDGGNEDGR